jgi:anti-sigma regulatory factor (Ser/Thr protein kinase)
VPAAARVSEARAAAVADAANLPQLTAFVQGFWSSAALPPGGSLAFELALEEVFMNVVMHGAKDRLCRVEVCLALTADGVTMTVEDDGPGFDPLSLPPPDVTSGLAERPVGGLGVFIVRQTMDDVSYARVAQLNQLRMTKRVAG